MLPGTGYKHTQTNIKRDGDDGGQYVRKEDEYIVLYELWVTTPLGNGK
jgi:hypothetical protein